MEEFCYLQYVLPFGAPSFSCGTNYKIATIGKTHRRSNTIIGKETNILIVRYSSSTYSKIGIAIFSIGFVAFTLHNYAKLVHHLINIDYSWKFELAMVIGMLLFQLPFIIKKPVQLKFEYYYNMLFVSLFGALFLWPLLLANRHWQMNDAINIAYFFAVVFVMFLEHKKRVAKLKLPKIISYTWVLYRFVILLFII